MRTLLKFSIPVSKGNQAIADGTLARVMQELMAAVSPEAVYFTTMNGRRGGYVVFDMGDPSQIPAIAEPLFRELDAEIAFEPVMNPDELMRGLAAAAQSSAR